MKLTHIIVLVALLLPSLGMAASHAIYCDDQGDQADSTQVASAEPEIKISGKGINGVVEVVFIITEDGKAQVVDIQSTTPILREYVLDKLKKIKLTETASKPGQTIRYRFVFQDQQV